MTILLRADGSGNWSYPLPLDMADGTYAVRARARADHYPWGPAVARPNLIIPTPAMAATRAFRARVAVPASPERVELWYWGFAQLQEQGLMAKLDALWFGAAHDPQATTLNLIGDRFNLTPMGPITYVTDRSFAANGSTSYLETSFNPATAAGQFARDAAHLGVWIDGSTGLTGGMIGSLGAFHFHYPSPTLAAINTDGARNTTIPGSSTAGHYLGVREGALLVKGYRDGALVVTDTDPTVVSKPLRSLTMTMGAIRYPAGLMQFTARPILAAHAGGLLTNAEQAALHSILHTWLHEMGAV